MANEELLLSISKMLDDTFNPLEKRMHSMEEDLKTEIRGVKEDVELVKEEVELVKGEVKNELELLHHRIDVLDNNLHLMNLKLENVFEPRMNTIESCYMDTYKRYQRECDRIDKLETDNELIRSIIQKHSKILQGQIA